MMVLNVRGRILGTKPLVVDMAVPSRISSLVVIPVAVLLAGDVAQAGTYEQHLCRLPDGRPAPTVGATPFTDGDGTVVNTCSEGGYVSLEIPAQTAAMVAVARWKWSGSGGKVKHLAVTRRVAGIAADRRYLMRWPPNDDACTASAPCSDEFSTINLDLSSAVVREFQLDLECDQGPCDGPADRPTTVDISRVVVTFEDAEPPTFSAAPGGTMLSPGPVSGIVEATFEAADRGGGVAEISLLVDGHEFLRRGVEPDQGCLVPYTRPVPCPTHVSQTVALDTTRLKNGIHEVVLVVYDATRENSARYGPVQIEVANSTSAAGSDGTNKGPQPNGVGADRGARIVLGRAAKLRTLVVRRGDRKAVRGRLLDSHGRPIAHAVLTIFDHTGKRMPKVVGTMKTNRAGRFVWIVEADRNRKLSLGYRAFADDRANAAKRSLAVVVPAPVELTPSRRHLRNGEELTLTASLDDVAARPGPARIAFQVRIGRLWRTFATRTLNKQARASVKHRFRVTYHTMTYRFRAMIMPGRGFPYGQGLSDPESVRVN